ncbi:type IV pilus modification protein PilV [Marinicella pacifica]|jgi:type IV pilus assembly protein PilV|uniref:Type IV pilus modification protein PilV n=1 Tax=Marinicella pacifica TaxID=1171543 RepID=A0A917CKA0_9GAMM|nr:type IV pilus modification protein PilV [Marinicella pacifica]GGF90605.1 type IV pilus modification protein PilV [Marinicella pacifica]
MKNKDDGFTLLEVLIAIVVFSFGLLGIAGMMTISVRNNHNGYLRSQANFLAENMLDRMRANPNGLWNSFYAGTATPGATACDLATPCNYQQLAQYDMQQWARSLQLALPSGQGTINCVINGTVPAISSAVTPPSIWAPGAPYNGVCTIQVTWNEANRDSASDLQTMELIAQP